MGEESGHVLGAAEAGEIIAAARDAGAAQLLIALRQVAAHAIDLEIRSSAARAVEAITAAGPDIRSIPAPERPRELPREPARQTRDPNSKSRSTTRRAPA